MTHSPIEVTKSDGSKQTILPFARPFIDAEAEYRAAHPVQATPSAKQVEHHPMSLRAAFYAVYIEPVILAAKMGTLECKELVHRHLH